MKHECEQAELLPDSGLPIDKEVERNIDSLLRDFLPDLKSKCEISGMTKKYLHSYLKMFREVALEKLGPVFEKEIIKLRTNESN